MTKDQVEVMFRVGLSLGDHQDPNPIRLAMRDDKTVYASKTERRSDYADMTIAFIEPSAFNRDEIFDLAYGLVINT